MNLVDALCPQIEFTAPSAEELVIPNHPVIGGRLSWQTTPIESSERIRQLLYAVTTYQSTNHDGNSAMTESEHMTIVDQLRNQFHTREVSMRMLIGISRCLDTNIIIIEQNSLHVITPNPKIYNTARHTAVVYCDGNSYYTVNHQQSIITILLNKRPTAFRQIVGHDAYASE